MHFPLQAPNDELLHDRNRARNHRRTLNDRRFLMSLPDLLDRLSQTHRLPGDQRRQNRPQRKQVVLNRRPSLRGLLQGHRGRRAGDLTHMTAGPYSGRSGSPHSLQYVFSSDLSTEHEGHEIVAAGFKHHKRRMTCRRIHPAAWRGRDSEDDETCARDQRRLGLKDFADSEIVVARGACVAPNSRSRSFSPIRRSQPNRPNGPKRSYGFLGRFAENVTAILGRQLIGRRVHESCQVDHKTDGNQDLNLNTIWRCSSVG